MRWVGLPDITMEDFVDTWLYLSFKANGIILGGYATVVKDSHKAYSEEEVQRIVEESVAAVLQRMSGGG